MFINPMWYDEVQAIGKQRCTPAGYRLHVISDLIGYVAIVLLFGVPCYLIYTVISSEFTWWSLLMLPLPFVVAVIGNILHTYSWHLAELRDFKYDYEKRISTWCNRSGTMESFDYQDLSEKYGDHSGPDSLDKVG